MKQAIIIRTDLKMKKGKIAAQAAHASLGAMKKARKLDVALWERWGGKKVVLKVGSLKSLKSVYRKAKSSRLPCFLVRDAGLTQVEEGSLTAIGIGPVADGKIDKIVKNLKLL
jgi:PTH2 family peptidyl-tRNA hydrolase